MWGGIYAVLFSIVTITSTENPLRNGFPFNSSKPYEKITFSKGLLLSSGKPFLKGFSVDVIVTIENKTA